MQLIKKYKGIIITYMILIGLLSYFIMTGPSKTIEVVDFSTNPIVSHLVRENISWSDLFSTYGEVISQYSLGEIILNGFTAKGLAVLFGIFVVLYSIILFDVKKDSIIAGIITYKEGISEMLMELFYAIIWTILIYISLDIPNIFSFLNTKANVNAPTSIIMLLLIILIGLTGFLIYGIVKNKKRKEGEMNEED